MTAAEAVEFTDEQTGRQGEGGGGGGARAKPEVSAGPVKDYKALVAVHDLFTARG